MLNKKLLLGLVAFSLLPLVSVHASNATDDENDSDLIYLRLGYQGTYVGDHTIDGAKAVVISGTGSAATAVLGTGDYAPKYAMNFMGGSIGVGKTFGDGARAELEIAANSQIEVDDPTGVEYFDNLPTAAAFANKGFKVGLASLNLYYDVDSGKPGFIPYVGGGVGLARVNFLSSPTSETITYPVALQFKAGLQVKLNNLMPVYVGYKLVYLVQKESDPITSSIPTGTAAMTTKPKSSYTLHNFDIGIMLVK